jgi:hypothetical protein
MHGVSFCVKDLDRKDVSSGIVEAYVVELNGLGNIIDSTVLYDDHSSNQVEIVLVQAALNAGNRIQQFAVDPRNPKEFQLLSHKQHPGIAGLASVFSSTFVKDPVFFSQGTWPEDPQIDAARRAEMLANRQLPALFSLNNNQTWTAPQISQIFGVTLVPGRSEQVS